MTKDLLLRRWVILEHRVSKDIITGRHFDLLLEEKNACRSWRMETIPFCDGPAVTVIPLDPHKLYWLEVNESAVSGDRGWAKRIDGGYFVGCLPFKIDECVSISDLRKLTDIYKNILVEYFK